MTNDRMRSPMFTVIIPTYNRRELLARAIGSVVDQSDSDWQLVVVDDASPTEVTVPIDSRIVLIRNETNLGKAASLNRAFTQSHGAIVMILDDDDLFGKHRLRNARTAHSLAPVVCCDGRLADRNEPLQFDYDELPEVELVPFTWNAHIPSAGALSIDRSHWVDFDPTFRACEDIDWVMRLQEQCSQMARIRSADWVWGRHDGPRHLNGASIRVEGSERLLAKHAAFFRGNPRAHANRLYRLGLLHRDLGNRSDGLRYALRSFLCHPNFGAVRLGVSALTAGLR